MNTLYFGDNLHILRAHIPTESVDLIYLDPPFNSKRNYNVYLNTPKGHQSDAQITAFEDTWHWSPQAEQEYTELLRSTNTDISDLLAALRRFLHESDMMAYLVMMTSRLLELHRVLKPTGSLYLHCDPTASHYLKIVLDNVFGAENFRSEIIWKRSSAHNDTKQGAKQPGKIHDTILFYSKSQVWIWNPVHIAYSEDYIESAYNKIDPINGKSFKTSDLSAAKGGGDTSYEWKGQYPPIGRYWAYSKENMQKFENDGRLYYSSNGKPYLKQYLDEMPGKHIQSIWDDVQALTAGMAERLGYPTQKPVALLERIINASSNLGDVVLDPFCGCGTAVHAAQKLGRNWIGIDITHLSISLIERRLKDAFPSINFETHGIPKDHGSATSLSDRDKYEFQYWACSLVGAQPYKGGKKGADGGTDGIRYFNDDDKTDKKIIVSVKGGGVTRTMIADLKNTVEREKASLGLFVTLQEPTAPMVQEAISAGYYTNTFGEQFPRIQILTIKDLLDGKTPNFRDLTRDSITFKKAKPEKAPKNQDKLL